MTGRSAATSSCLRPTGGEKYLQTVFDEDWLRARKPARASVQMAAPGCLARQGDFAARRRPTCLRLNAA
ncbi:hypothetical protein ACTMU2_11740 [Cupriavidus basilensis]